MCAICFAEIIAAVVSACNESVCSDEGAAGSGIVLNYDYVLLVAVPVGPAVVVVAVVVAVVVVLVVVVVVAAVSRSIQLSQGR